MINDFHVHVGKSSSGEMRGVEDLLRSMDKYGIERSGLSILNGVSTPELNNQVMEAVKAHPDRIVGFAYINPREPGAIDEVRRCLESGLFRGVKFHSWKHGYFPDNNGSIDGIIEAVAAYGVAALCHTGTAPMALPQQWAAIAARHPNVDFVFAHIGYLDFGYGCVECARPLRNVCVDTSGQHEIPVIQKALDELGPERVIFATDWPYKYPGSELVKFEPYGLDEDAKAKICYENALRLWKL
jgi:predicted TIM-barrel fold metal-dependent hydrolase